jgi:hypothetical protein
MENEPVRHDRLLAVPVGSEIGLGRVELHETYALPIAVGHVVNRIPHRRPGFVGAAARVTVRIATTTMNGNRIASPSSRAWPESPHGLP